MKRTTCFLLGLLAGLGLIHAQGTPISSYKMELGTGTPYHDLGTSATLLLENAEGLNLNDLLLGKPGLSDTIRLESSSDDFISNERNTIKATRTLASIELGNFSFGKSLVSKAGITADGMVFLTATDSITAHSDKWDNSSIHFMNQRNIHDYIYFALVNVKEHNYYPDYEPVFENGNWVTKETWKSDPNSDLTVPTPLYGTADTKIGYEKEGDIVYICYENIRMTARDNHEQIVSWNYQIDTKTGKIGLQTKGFFTDDRNDTAEINMKWGLVTDEDKSVWLTGFSGITTIERGCQSVRMGKDPYAENEAEAFHKPLQEAVYQFVLPEPCTAISDAHVKWSNSMSISQNAINITNSTTWDKGQKALFVISEHATLAGENMPVDGTVYENSAVSPRPGKLGDGQAIVAKIMEQTHANEEVHTNIENAYSHFDNLKSATDYYIHTFVFNDTCSNGPVYGNPLEALKLRTLMGNPAPFAIKAVTKNSITINLPEAEGRKYVVAFSDISMTMPDGTPIPGLLKNDVTYTENQRVTYFDGVDNLTFTIVKVGVGSGDLALTGLESGKGYRILVWMMDETGTGVSYSGNYTENTARPFYTLPANVNFIGETVSSLPIGWESPTVTDSALDHTSGTYLKSTLSDFRVQYTTMTGGEILSCNLDWSKRDMTTNLVKSYAVSPWFDRGTTENITTSFSTRFYAMEGESFIPYKVREGDSVVFSWQENGETEWKRIAVRDKQTLQTSQGIADMTVDLKTSKNLFRYRMDYYHQTHEGDPSSVYFALYGITVNEMKPCQAPVNIEAPQDEMGYGSVTVKWEDGNRTGSEAETFMFSLQNPNTGKWDTVRTKETSVEFSKLRTNQTYNAKLQAVCGAERGVSAIREINFTTPAGMPYEKSLTRQSNNFQALPDEYTAKSGKPGDNLTTITFQNDKREGWLYGPSSYDNYRINYDLCAMQPQIAKIKDAWMISPAIFSEYDGKALLRFDMAAFSTQGKEETFQSENLSLGHDTLWIYASHDGSFKEDRIQVGFVDLAGRTKEFSYDSLYFDIEAEKGYFFGFYLPGIDDAQIAALETAALAIRRIEVSYDQIEYPAVTNLRTEGVTQNSVTVAWRSGADSCVILWKEAVAEKYDTVTTRENRHTFTGLKKETRYNYRVYGIYGTETGKISAERSVTTIGEIIIDTVATPQFNPASGTVAKGTKVSISCTTENARIYYTLDGSEPNTGSSPYIIPITIDSSVTIKAIAVSNGKADSKVAEAAYTVSVANDGREIAGVRVYPNPNDGRFHLVVPERAFVEVIAANGSLINRMEVPAGATALHLDITGIYFLRIDIDGQVAVKKVVVR